MKRLILSILFCAALFSCGNQPKKAVDSAPKPFPKVKTPTMMNSQEQIIQYVTVNYWNAFLDSVQVFPKDTNLVGGVSRDNFQQAYMEYAGLLSVVNPEVAFSAQTKLMQGAEALQKKMPETTVFQSICELADIYLYGVNSDYRNEEYYIPVLEALIRSEQTDSLSRVKYIKQLESCSLNRIGQTATDFHFTTRESKKGSLHNIKADYTLLFFSNPGCEACLDIINALKDSPQVSALIENKKLAVLNIYIDEDLTEWFKYMPIYPKEWTNAYDPDLIIRNSHLYDVRAIPSLYMLDREKRVIYKDAPPTMIFQFLSNIIV